MAKCKEAAGSCFQIIKLFRLSLGITKPAFTVRNHHSSVCAANSPSMEQDKRKACIFCKIADGVLPAETVYKDEEFVVFVDSRPATPHHYLVIPRQHYCSAKVLTHDHVDLVTSMVALARRIMEERRGSTTELRMGFHWPPFTTIQHLHLHAIAPEGEMSFIARGIFKTNSWWFVSPDYVLQRLNNKGSS